MVDIRRLGPRKKKRSIVCTGRRNEDHTLKRGSLALRSQTQRNRKQKDHAQTRRIQALTMGRKFLRTLTTTVPRTGTGKTSTTYVSRLLDLAATTRHITGLWLEAARGLWSTLASCRIASSASPAESVLQSGRAPTNSQSRKVWPTPFTHALVQNCWHESSEDERICTHGFFFTTDPDELDDFITIRPR